MTLVSKAAQDRARKIVESLGGRWNGTRGECRCPAHDDHSPSLSVRLGTSAILFKCFAGCSQSAVLKALDRNGFENRSPVNMPSSRRRADFSDLARNLWTKSIPIMGTPAQTYLQARDLFPDAQISPMTLN